MVTPKKDPKDLLKVGRKTKFNNEKTIRLASCLYEIGKTDAEVAELIGVTETTINNWKIKHPKFFESLNEAKDVANQEIERSLFERAKGYTHPAEKIFLSKDGEIVRANFTEHYPPDPTSMIFWLKNRDKNRWKDKQEHEHSGNMNLTVNVTLDPPPSETK